jgi:2-keto-4-pentenoate hydratase/2-oxohepta-3-ene-1,7-dioic acid hydratase in catechol pathway
MFRSSVWGWGGRSFERRAFHRIRGYGAARLREEAARAASTEFDSRDRVSITFPREGNEPRNSQIPGPLHEKSRLRSPNPEDPIVIPDSCKEVPEVDYEAELGVVIGKTAKNVPEENALEYVFGYTAGNDISARRWQKHAGGGQWVRGKSFDTFCPIGPELVTADEIPDPQKIGIRNAS